MAKKIDFLQDFKKINQKPVAVKKPKKRKGNKAK